MRYTERHDAPWISHGGEKHQNPKIHGLLDLADAIIYLTKTGVRIHEWAAFWHHHEHPRRVLENLLIDIDESKQLDIGYTRYERIEWEHIYQLPLLDYLRVRFLREETCGAMCADDTKSTPCDNCAKELDGILGPYILTRCRHCGTAYYVDSVLYRVDNPPAIKKWIP